MSATPPFRSANVKASLPFRVLRSHRRADTQKHKQSTRNFTSLLQSSLSYCTYDKYADVFWVWEWLWYFSSRQDKSDFFIFFFLIWATGWDVCFSVCTKEGPCETLSKTPAEYLLLLHENKSFRIWISAHTNTENLQRWSRGHKPLKSCGAYAGSIIFSCTGQCWDFSGPNAEAECRQKDAGGASAGHVS